MKRFWMPVALWVLLAISAGCASPARTLRVSGEDASVSGFLTPARETFEEESGGVRLDILRSRPGIVLSQLVRGEVDAVVSVHSLDELLRAAAEEQVRIDPSLLQSVDVGRSDTAILLNRRNPVSRLTRGQLKGIFSGRIGNWKQLHGFSRGIVVVWNMAPAAADDPFVREILGGEKFAPKVRPVYSYDEVRKLVAEIPDAIGIVPSAYASASVSLPVVPKLSSPVIVVTRGKPSPQVSSLTSILRDIALLQ